MVSKGVLYGRIKGALMGVAYGDSFGMPVEMWSREKITSAYGEINIHLPGNPDNSISKGLRAYEVTDDTLNTLMVIDMLVQNNGYVDPAIFIRLLKAWAKASVKSTAVIGPSTGKAIKAIEAGVPMEQTGKTGTTNGGAMKILPLGLLHRIEDLEELVADVDMLCLPTHHTSLAVSGAAAVAAAACHALNDGRDWTEMLHYSQKAAEMGKKRGSQIGGPSVSARLKLFEVFAAEHTAEEALGFIEEIIGTGLPAEESAAAAVGLAYLARGEPELCARYAVALGGDTDTVAAMACGISGAASGESAFQTGVIKKIEEVNSLSFDEQAEKMMIARGMRIK